MNLRQRAAVSALLASATFLSASVAAEEHFPVKVVVLTAFDPELQKWITDLPLPVTIPFPQGAEALHYNPDLQVLGMVTGQGKSRAAASIMGLGFDPRFDLSHAYWVVAAIAGVDPNKASVASVAWAKFIVDGDLSHLIDSREIPPGWTTGFVPLGRSTPYEPPSQPYFSNYVQQVYQLNAGLADFALKLTANLPLPDDVNLQRIRAGYPHYPNALKPAFVLEGDDLATDTFWTGKLLNTWAENWVTYWTAGQGSFVMSDYEDTAIGQALQFLSQVRRADQNRLLILRGGSNYTVPPEGQTAEQFLRDQNSGGLSALHEVLNTIYQVGRVVVLELSHNWDAYENHVPEAKESLAH
jgi:purine nucleoside permease